MTRKVGDTTRSKQPVSVAPPQAGGQPPEGERRYDGVVWGPKSDHSAVVRWDIGDRASEVIGKRPARKARSHEGHRQSWQKLLLTADVAVGSSLLEKLTLPDVEKRRIQTLTAFVAGPVRAKLLLRPGDRARALFADSESAASTFTCACWAMIEYFSAPESINTDRMLSAVSDFLRPALECMDEEERKKTIAGLMAYIGELQASGVLESVPSDRLARVAKLIGEAAEIVSADPSTFIPLFRDREVDPTTGKKPTALEWFDAVWKPRVDAGEIVGADIKRDDPVFYSNLSSTLSRRGQKLADLLPPSRTGRPRNGGSVDTRLAHTRELNRKRAARWRASKREPQ